MRQGIAALNASEPAQDDGESRYYVLHRRRLWNEGEGRFIGWERKRGKLEELNRLLLGHGNTSFLPDATGQVAMPAACAMCSLSMPIRDCRWARCAHWWARLRIR